MIRRPLNPIRIRNILLIEAAVFVLIAIIQHPGILLLVGSRRGWIAMALTILAGLFAAIGIRQLAKSWFRKPGQPWYVRPWVFIFLTIMLVTMTVGFVHLQGFISSILGMKIASNICAWLFIFTAMALIWITVLDWPSYRH